MITTYNYLENEKKNRNRKIFKIMLPPENCGLLMRKCCSEDISRINVKIRKQTTAENGNIAAVVIDNEPTVRIVFYNRLENNQIVLLDPNKYDFKKPYGYCYNPDKKGDEHVILTAAEAATRLKILGVVVESTVFMKNSV